MTNKDKITLAGMEVYEEEIEESKNNKRKKRVMEKVNEVKNNTDNDVHNSSKKTNSSFKSKKSVLCRKIRFFFKRRFPIIISIYYKLVLIMLMIIAISSYSYMRINELLQENKTLMHTNLKLKETIKLNTKDKLKIERELKILKNKLNGSSFVIVSRETLMNDMKKRFSNISPKIAKIIVDTVIEEAKKYNINPIILYSLGIVESSHRFWIEHAKRLVVVPKESGKGTKRIYVRAVGWGGIVYEHHHKLLKEKGILSTRADLFYPDVNIRAAAAIYNMYFHMPRKRGTTNADESAQRRYFGGNFKSYSDKINKQVVTLVKAEIYRLTNKKGDTK